jgi:hypothetical protein
MRIRDRSIPSISQRMGLDSLKPESGAKARLSEVLTFHTVGDSRVCLISSEILGAQSDWWIATYRGGKWSVPLFTGFRSDSHTFDNSSDQPANFQGISVRDLRDGKWVQAFGDDHSLADDADSDGLTDREEERLGTDLQDKDSDGDGLSDLKDGNPLAPKRELTEDEQILAAIFEARYHVQAEFGGRQAAVFVAPTGAKPFELIGWMGPLIWSESRSTNLGKCYGQGVGIIRFDPRPDAEDLPAKTPVWDKYIQWNADHTEASATISTYFGGLNGTGYTGRVRKFGSSWVVVSMEMTYIS